MHKKFRQMSFSRASFLSFVQAKIPENHGCFRVGAIDVQFDGIFIDAGKYRRGIATTLSLALMLAWG